MYRNLFRWPTLALTVLLVSACGGRDGLFLDDGSGDSDSATDSDVMGTDSDVDTGAPQYPVRAVSVSSGAGTVTSQNYKCRMSVGGTPKAGAVSATYKAQLGVGPVLSLKKRGHNE